MRFLCAVLLFGLVGGCSGSELQPTTAQHKIEEQFLALAERLSEVASEELRGNLDGVIEDGPDSGAILDNGAQAISTLLDQVINTLRPFVRPWEFTPGSHEDIRAGASYLLRHLISPDGEVKRARILSTAWLKSPPAGHERVLVVEFQFLGPSAGDESDVFLVQCSLASGTLRFLSWPVSSGALQQLSRRRLPEVRAGLSSQLIPGAHFFSLREEPGVGDPSQDEKSGNWACYYRGTRLPAHSSAQMVGAVFGVASDIIAFDTSQVRIEADGGVPIKDLLLILNALEPSLGAREVVLNFVDDNEAPTRVIGVQVLPMLRDGAAPMADRKALKLSSGLTIRYIAEGAHANRALVWLPLRSTIAVLAEVAAALSQDNGIEVLQIGLVD